MLGISRKKTPTFEASTYLSKGEGIQFGKTGPVSTKYELHILLLFIEMLLFIVTSLSLVPRSVTVIQ